MTRARALKQTIRARAAKTGERYTTARRHVLAGATGATGETVAPVAPAPPVARATMSDAAFVKKTGHNLAHWFAILDTFGAVEKGHTAAARHLYDVHKVDGWYGQGIVVSYERARGVRVANQRCDGAFEVSSSKTVAATAKRLAKAFTDARERASWLIDVDPELAAALAKGVSAKKSAVVVRPDGLVRYRYKWDDTTVQFYMSPKPGGKYIVSVQHMKLANAEAVDPLRAKWKTALTALAGHLTA